MSFSEEICDFDSDAKLAMGQRIKEARRDAGIKAIDLAEMLGITTTQMSRIENGKDTCTTANLYKIGRLLNVSVDFLLYDDKQALVVNEIVFEVQGLRTRELEGIRDVIRIMKQNFTTELT